MSRFRQVPMADAEIRHLALSRCEVLRHFLRLAKPTLLRCLSATLFMQEMPGGYWSNDCKYESRELDSHPWSTNAKFE